jgi:hypothetical protein
VTAVRPVRGPGAGTLGAGLALAGPPHLVAEPNDELAALLREHAERLSPLARRRFGVAAGTVSPGGGSGMRHFGVLAHSWEGGSACFRSFCQEGFAKLGGFEHPDVTLDSVGHRAMPTWRGGPVR